MTQLPRCLLAPPPAARPELGSRCLLRPLTWGLSSSASSMGSLSIPGMSTAEPSPARPRPLTPPRPADQPPLPAQPQQGGPAKLRKSRPGTSTAGPDATPLPIGWQSIPSAHKEKAGARRARSPQSPGEAEWATETKASRVFLGEGAAPGGERAGATAIIRPCGLFRQLAGQFLHSLPFPSQLALASTSLYSFYLLVAINETKCKRLRGKRRLICDLF